jgi:hypothetical protein
MSQASIEIVREFFTANGFFVLRNDDILLVKNSLKKEESLSERFVLSADSVSGIDNGMVRVVSWHTMKFTPGVLQKNPEIFDFTSEENVQLARKSFLEEPFIRILVIPAFPVSDDLRKKSEDIMKARGIDRAITFPSIVSGLINKIESRHVYQSSVNEVLRILKFYRFFAEEEQNLPV